MTYRIGLDFLDPNPEQRKAGLPPTAHLFLKRYTVDGRQRIFISPDCACQGELDYEINKLHDELETLRRAATRRFAKAEALRKVGRRR